MEDQKEEEEGEEGGRRRAEGQPPPRSPSAVASVASRLGSEGGSVQERGRGGDEKFPEGESGAGVYICPTGFAREAAEASKINLERRGGRRSRF